jgi:protein TonB
MRNHQTFSIFRHAYHHLGVILGAVGLTFIFFFVLPLMQTISQPPTDDLLLQAVDVGNVEPPPPPPIAEEPEPEPELDEQPPELMEQEAPPLDLSQLELALNPGFSEGWMGGGDFAVKLNTIVSTSNNEDLDAVFSMADLDQKPRVIYQPSPVLNRQLRQKAPATVYIIFMVNELGRVEEPRIQSSSNPIFETPALAALKRWKFETGKRGGKPVRSRMRVPITFPGG